jgi:two-component system sensor histidine kinase ChvG
MALVERSQAGDPAPPAADAAAPRMQRGRLSLRGSALTRRIVAFNLVALGTLVIGLLCLDDTRERLVRQHEQGLRDRAVLSAGLVAARLTPGGPGAASVLEGRGAQDALARLALPQGTDAYLFDPAGRLRAQQVGGSPPPGSSVAAGPGPTGMIARSWRAALAPFAPVPKQAGHGKPRLRALAMKALTEGAASRAGPAPVLLAAAPVMKGATPMAALVLADRSGASDRIAGAARERLLRMILIATLVSVALSLALASTIATPLADLAAAAEAGPAAAAGIPDLTARPDEIGRLSGALRGMVDALTARIESNEQFAADVAHEIKNPLASLRSAVGTMRIARADQRDRLLEVIEHDVRRLDRLVGDISKASRLDADLVRETEAGVDLVALLQGLARHLGDEAGQSGIELITDFPAQPIRITGLEPRLAQVFANLITNAISFCQDGDAIRIWARLRANRVLVVVEDTGPGIPEESLDKIFARFYSQRPEGEFGNNSGLGLAISRQIVEAHEGVIWAENIRPTEADPTSDPLGARFVVGLPV